MVFIKVFKGNKAIVFISIAVSLEFKTIDTLIDAKYNIRKSTAEEWEDTLGVGTLFEITTQLDLNNLITDLDENS